MNDFFTTQHFLINQIQADPLLSLAYTVSTLDPLWNSADDLYAPEHETDALYIALHILRRPFPELYFDTLGAIQAGKPYDHIESMICQTMQSHGIPLDDLEWIGYSIPLPAYGVEWDHPDFTTSYPEALPLLACFGVTLETEYTISDELRATVQRITETLASDQDKHWQQVGWVIQWLFSCTGNSSVLCGIKNTKSSEPLGLDEAYTIGRLIADDLENHADNRYQQVSWLLKWLFSSTNNSCVDWDEETMYSVEPLSWEPQDVAFAVEIIAEAETIMADAMSGLQWLLQRPQILLALWQNIAQVQRALAKQSKKSIRLELTWPDPTALPPLTLPEYLPAQSG